MGVSKAKRQITSPTDPLFPHMAEGLDFVDVSFFGGLLKVEGTGVHISVRPGRLQKLLIDAVDGPPMLWFRNIEVPVEIDTTEFGKAVVYPTRGATLLPLIAPPGVLLALGFQNGLKLGPVVNIDAILGLLSELKCENDTLIGATGYAVSKQACLGLLDRLGVITARKANVLSCLKILTALGLKQRAASRLLPRLRQRVRGPVNRLSRSIRLLEERGYRLRLNGRLNTICRPTAVTFDSTENSPWRLIPFADHSNAYRAAA